MKKYFNLLTVLVLSLITSISLLSCDDFGSIGSNEDGSVENNGNNNGNGNDQGNNNDSIGNSSQVYRDKEDFQRIAIELMDEFKTSDFENIMELAEYICKEYAELETGEAEEWLDGCLDELSKDIESNETYPIYETIYKASAFKGRFVAEEGCWKKYESDNLSIHVKDQNGNPCEIMLTTSGRTKKVHCWDDYKNMTELGQNPFFRYSNSISSNIQGGLGYWCGYGATEYLLMPNDHGNPIKLK